MPPLPREAPFKGRGQKTPNQRLTDAAVIEARQLIKTMSCRAIAEKFGVSYMAMYGAIRGTSFKHLNFEHPPQW